LRHLLLLEWASNDAVWVLVEPFVLSTDRVLPRHKKIKETFICKRVLVEGRWRTSKWWRHVLRNRGYMVPSLHHCLIRLHKALAHHSLVPSWSRTIHSLRHVPSLTFRLTSPAHLRHQILVELFLLVLLTMVHRCLLIHVGLVIAVHCRFEGRISFLGADATD
jgi:hypothetical protein